LTFSSYLTVLQQQQQAVTEAKSFSSLLAPGVPVAKIIAFMIFVFSVRFTRYATKAICLLAKH